MIPITAKFVADGPGSFSVEIAADRNRRTASRSGADGAPCRNSSRHAVAGQLARSFEEALERDVSGALRPHHLSAR